MLAGTACTPPSDHEQTLRQRKPRVSDHAGPRISLKQTMQEPRKKPLSSWGQGLFGRQRLDAGHLASQVKGNMLALDRKPATTLDDCTVNIGVRISKRSPEVFDDHVGVKWQTAEHVDKSGTHGTRGILAMHPRICVDRRVTGREPDNASHTTFERIDIDKVVTVRGKENIHTEFDRELFQPVINQAEISELFRITSVGIDRQVRAIDPASNAFQFKQPS